MRLDGKYNLANVDIARQITAGIGAEVAKAKARGDAGNWHEVKVREVRLSQSEKLRNYYYGVVVETYRNFLADDHPNATKGMAHRRLKLQGGLAIEEVNPLTHELEITGTESLADLTTNRLVDYVERVRAWLDTDVHCPTDDPDPYYMVKRRARREVVPA